MQADQMVRTEIRNAAQEFSSYLDRDFSEQELALGFASFVLWYLHGLDLQARDDDEGFSHHIGAANQTARDSAVVFSLRVAGDRKVLPALILHFHAFDPTREAEVAALRIGPSDERWSEWKQSLTRVLILVTRSLAWALIQDRYTTVDVVLAQPAIALRFALEWLAEATDGSLSSALGEALLDQVERSRGLVTSGSSPPTQGPHATPERPSARDFVPLPSSLPHPRAGGVGTHPRVEPSRGALAGNAGPSVPPRRPSAPAATVQGKARTKRSEKPRVRPPDPPSAPPAPAVPVVAGAEAGRRMTVGQQILALVLVSGPLVIVGLVVGMCGGHLYLLDTLVALFIITPAWGFLVFMTWASDGLEPR